MTANGFIEGVIAGICFAAGVLYFLVLLPLSRRIKHLEDELADMAEQRCMPMQAPPPRRRTRFDRYVRKVIGCHEKYRCVAA
jgi:hypothetical protein